MSKNDIALITYAKLPDLTASDSLLLEPLKKAGFTVQAVPWDNPGIDWTEFGCLILRSCWNYHYKYSEFLDWLLLLERKNIKLWNSYSVVRWNMNKTYLKSLAEKGISTVPTVFLEKNQPVNLQDLAAEKSWSELVVKPCIGASAYEIFRVGQNKYQSGQKKLDKLVQKSQVMIQPLMEEVITQGEYSFVFIGGKYSHAMLKKPRKGGFRSNYQFGASEIQVRPDKNLIEQARMVLECVDSPLLYARVDGVNQEGKFILMELELIEPHLFFDQNPHSPPLFAESVKNLNK